MVAVVVVIDQGLWDYVTGYRGVVVEDECCAYEPLACSLFSFVHLLFSRKTTPRPRLGRSLDCFSLADLGPPSNSTNTCVLYWCLAAISGFCALFAFFAAACGRGRRSPGTLCALPFAAVLFLAAAITNSVVVPQANDQ